MLFTSEFPDVQPLDQPVFEVVLGGARARGDRPALIDAADGTMITYAQLDHSHRRIAAGLAAAGLVKGDVLALHSPNTIHYPAAFYGASRAGATVTTVHPLATAEEFARQLTDCGARWIVTISPLLPVARAAAALSGGVEQIFTCDKPAAPNGQPEVPSLVDMLDGEAPEPRVPVDPAQDIAALPYSSGTTGTPKGVMLTHRSIATNLEQCQAVRPAGEGERILAVLPFFHVYGLTVLMNIPLRNGATVVVMPRFDIHDFLSAVQEHRVQGLYVAPPIVLALAKHPAVADHDLSSLDYVLSSAAPLDAELADACAKRLGLPPIGQAYGMTELSPGSHVVPRDSTDQPPGTVGKLVPNTEMRIASPENPGQDLGPGVPGEILVRGPQVMAGYLGRPQETADMIDADGWLRTGDVGYVDDDGWLFVVDRVKELIKYKGFQVAPAELEALLLTHPAVADAAVIGITESDGNEVPKAYVVVREAAGPLDEGQVMDYVAERVAPYKKVRQVHFTDSIPRAVSGKILRRELRDHHAGATGAPGGTPPPAAGSS